MTELLLPDVEMAVRTWARSLDLGPATGRVFLGIPDSPRFPLVTVQRVGGLADDMLPVDEPSVQFDVWARSRADAMTVMRRLVQALRSLTPTVITYGTETARLDQAVGVTDRWLPDGEAHLARYVVEATLTLRPTTP